MNRPWGVRRTSWIRQEVWEIARAIYLETNEMVTKSLFTKRHLHFDIARKRIKLGATTYYEFVLKKSPEWGRSTFEDRYRDLSSGKVQI